MPSTSLRAPGFSNRHPLAAWMLAIAVALATGLPAKAFAATAAPSLLQAADLAKLIPSAVFFRGQVASTQLRNSGGVKMPDGMLVLCALVDTSGYSTGIQEKYQGYFITEATLDINGQMLKPGAYGVGFLPGNRFVVMDLGAHDIFTTSSTHDAELKRPTPLQMLADTAPEKFRLYINRNYIVFSRAPGQ